MQRGKLLFYTESVACRYKHKGTLNTGDGMSLFGAVHNWNAVLNQ